jgi:hypothetical protein
LGAEPSFTLFVPNVAEKVQAVLYNDGRVAQFTAEKNIVNKISFAQNGAMTQIYGVPYCLIPLPASYGCRGNAAHIHVVSWDDKGTLLDMLIGNSIFDLPGGVTVENPFKLTWWKNQKLWFLCAVEVKLKAPMKITFKKGTHTFYKLVDREKGAWEPYTKVFDKDTTVNVEKEFYINSEGQITYYR